MKTEPCMCGDPWCPKCFPRSPTDYDLPDADEGYERERQEELDEAVS